MVASCPNCNVDPSLKSQSSHEERSINQISCNSTCLQSTKEFHHLIEVTDSIKENGKEMSINNDLNGEPRKEKILEEEIKCEVIVSQMKKSMRDRSHHLQWKIHKENR
jgi:hypothetical protein